MARTLREDEEHHCKLVKPTDETANLHVKTPKGCKSDKETPHTVSTDAVPRPEKELDKNDI